MSSWIPASRQWASRARAVLAKPKLVRSGMTSPQAYQLAKNSFAASFIDEQAKRRYVDLLDATFAAFD